VSGQKTGKKGQRVFFFFPLFLLHPSISLFYSVLLLKERQLKASHTRSSKFPTRKKHGPMTSSYSNKYIYTHRNIVRE
jgi:hypothetical protein